MRPDGASARTSTPVTVRDATFEVLRRRGMTKIFSNPGSTEVPFLVDLPSDLEFVLALHEGSVVGIATGYALGRGQPSFVLLHTTPGLGNAVSALATSRVNRAPLVVAVGQQDRRHLAHEPFLAGKLAGLAGEYPVWVDQPVRPQDVPGCARAGLARGADAPRAGARDRADGRLAGPGARAARVRRSRPSRPGGRGGRRRGRGARAAARAGRVSGARRRRRSRRSGDVGRSRRARRAPRRAGLAGALRRARRLSADAPALRGRPLRRPRQAPRGALRPRRRPRRGCSRLPPVRLRGRPVRRGRNGRRRRHRGSRRGAAQPRAARRARAAGVGVRRARRTSAAAGRRAAGAEAGLRAARARATRCAPGTSSPSWPTACRKDAIVLEEAPSNRPELLARLPARDNLGLISPAMGGLGFAMPAAIGLRLALPSRPVVAIIGDGSSLYAIQSLWSAATYGSGALFVILKNGGYAIMDRLAEHEGGASAWPNVDVDIAGLARDLRLRRAADSRPRLATGGARRGRPRPRRPQRAAPARGHGRAGLRLQSLASPRPRPPPRRSGGASPTAPPR